MRQTSIVKHVKSAEMDIRQKKAASSATQFPNDKGKDSDFGSQYQIVYQCFKERPKSMLDVFLETGILRANICRYVADMENKGLIQRLYKAEDEHTGAIAGYYTADKELFRKTNDSQLKLWEDD